MELIVKLHRNFSPKLLLHIYQISGHLPLLRAHFVDPLLPVWHSFTLLSLSLCFFSNLLFGWWMDFVNQKLFNYWFPQVEEKLSLSTQCTSLWVNKNVLTHLHPFSFKFSCGIMDKLDKSWKILLLDRMIPLETNMKTGNDSCTTATYSFGSDFRVGLWQLLFFFFFFGSCLIVNLYIFHQYVLCNVIFAFLLQVFS